MASETTDHREAKAAVNIQRVYRGHRQRTLLGLTASQRWDEALAEARWRKLVQPVSRLQTDSGSSAPGSSSRPLSSPPGAMWKKAVGVAKMAQHDDYSDPDFSGLDDESLRIYKDELRRKRTERAENSKTIDMQYFLEMVDLKHRYGANLRAYHEFWKHQDTHENFFYWLDYGDGQVANLSSCPRDQLERERIRYLSREERQAYLVKIDADGHLCWAKTGEKIDTTKEFADSNHGIVPLGDPNAYCDETNHGRDETLDSSAPATPESSSSSTSSDSGESVRANRYANTKINANGQAKRTFQVSPATILDRLLRGTVKKNTWIFVVDNSFRLYVGIKQSGAFQHSSFLHGSRVYAAGLIKIKDGKLKCLSPLSGHYRPSASSFKRFLHSFKDEGVDMNGVTISKSYAVLIGLEVYGNLQKKKRKLKLATKEAVCNVVGHRRNNSSSSTVYTTNSTNRNVHKRESSNTSNISSLWGITGASVGRRKPTIEEEQPRTLSSYSLPRDENGLAGKFMKRLRITHNRPA